MLRIYLYRSSCIADGGGGHTTTLHLCLQHTSAGVISALPYVVYNAALKNAPAMPARCITTSFLLADKHDVPRGGRARLA